MTPSPRWEQWDGIDYPTEKNNPTIYYYPGRLDIEEPENLNDLITEIHQDGVVPSKRDARDLLDTAIVVHGQVRKIDGELHYLSASKQDSEDEYFSDRDATWVELDSYVE